MAKKKLIEIASGNQANTAVNEIVGKATKLIREEICKYEDKSRWLLFGRVIASLFNQHYQLSIVPAVAIERRREEIRKQAGENK